MPIYYPNGNYPLPVHGHMVLDINIDAGQSDIWVQNQTVHDGATYTISVDHGQPTAHGLNAGAAANYDSLAPVHYHVNNTGAVALQISLS